MTNVVKNRARRAVCLEAAPGTAAGAGSRLFGALSSRRMASAACAELLGVGFVIFMGCMAAARGVTEHALLHIALVFGLAVTTSVQVTHLVSGGHLNPAVTLGAVLRGDLTLPAAVVYVIAQLAGSALGFGLLLAVMPLSVHCDCTTVPQHVSSAQAFGIEATGAAGLVMLTHSIWDQRNKSAGDTASIKLGFLVAIYAMGADPYTGGSMNPARSFGPAIWNNIWTNHWVYWVGPLTGSVLGSLVYLTIFEEHQRPQSADTRSTCVSDIPTITREIM